MGISTLKINGKIYYQVNYQAQGIRHQSSFKELSDAKEWLESVKQEYSRKVPSENERFIDISFSGLKNKNNQKLYIAFDKNADAYRLVSASQIKNKSNPRRRGIISKTQTNKYQLSLRKDGKRYNIGTFKTKEEAIKNQKQVLHQIALGKPIKISTRSNTGFKYISKQKDGNYRFKSRSNKHKIEKVFHTLQEALDYREKYFKENGLEMPKEYIEF